MKKFLLPILLFIILMPFVVEAREINNIKEFEQTEKSINIVLDKEQNLIRVGYCDEFNCLIKSDKDNNILWKKTYDNLYSGIYGLTLDDNDNIYVSIIKREPITRIEDLAVNGETYNFYLIKYDKNGNLLFEKKIEKNNEIIKKYTINDLQYIDGYIYASGTEYVDVHFKEFKTYNEDDPAAYVKYAYYDCNAIDVLMKIDKNGNPIWERNYGTKRSETIIYVVEGSASGHFSYNTFARKKYFVRADSVGNKYVLAVKMNNSQSSTPGEIISKYSANGDLFFSKNLNSRIYTTDFIIDNNYIIFVGKKFKDYNPPNPLLSYNEKKALPLEEQIAYDKKFYQDYNPYIYYLNLNGEFVKDILWENYDRSLFHSIIKINEDFIMQMCSYNESENQNECYDIILLDDMQSVFLKGNINHISSGVDFHNDYTLEENIIDESNNEYYILVSSNEKYATFSRIIICNYQINYGDILINNNEKFGILEIDDVEHIKESTLKLFTIEPKDDYELVNIEIKDKNDNKIEYTKIRDNEYEFVMPDTDVIIIPTYRKIESINVPDTLKNPNTGTGISIIIIFMLIISSITYIIFKRKKNYIMK